MYTRLSTNAMKRSGSHGRDGRRFALNLPTSYRRWEVSYKVQLIYFRQTGKFLAVAETALAYDAIAEIWAEVDDMRRLGRLPGLRPGAGRDLFVLVDVPQHPQRVLHLVMAPFLDEDDVTPPGTPTGEMVPLVRMPLAEIPRTSTRDVVRPPEVDPDDITPVEHPIPKPPRDA